MDFDTDISNYSDDELIQLLELSDVVDNNTIITSTQKYIDKYNNNEELVNFYTNIRNRLLKEETNTVTSTFNSEIKQGTINPDLKNTITRMINIDSTYRDSISTLGYDTDQYMFTLNEPITNVISLMLYSVEIPQSWYTFMESKQNTKCILNLIEYDTTYKYTVSHNYTLQVNDGNYSSKSLLIMLSNVLKNCGVFLHQPDTFILSQDVYSGRFQMEIISTFDYSKIILPDGNTFTPSLSTKFKLGFTFHSKELNNKINYNFGWLLGFRIPIVLFSDVLPNQISDKSVFINATSIIDTAGTKYIILRLDDFKPNRLNKSLVCINTKSDKFIPLPSYYNKSISQYSISNTEINVLSNAPRVLTAKQQHTINSIANNKLENSVNYRIQSPDDSDIFAKIPIKKNSEWCTVSDNTPSLVDSGPGKLIIDFSGPLQLNVREYFGPVNMTSFAVSLFDDKGMILGLNGMDWSFTIIAKSIYQY
jgi:hypothetical protein